MAYPDHVVADGRLLGGSFGTEANDGEPINSKRILRRSFWGFDETPVF
jgi:hypothetical protein